MEKKTKKRNPNDATIRNVRALNSRIVLLKHRIDTLCATLNDLQAEFADHCRCVAINTESFNTRLINLENNRRRLAF